MLLITGSSGQLSSLISGKATAARRDTIIGGRTLTGNEPGKRRIDFDDPASLDLSGVRTLMLVSAGFAEDDVVIKRHDNIIAAAERQGVPHIVYTSLTATGDHLAFALAHRWTERRLQESTLAWTILRNGLYAELIGSLVAPAEGAINAPFGAGRISAVAREDLADAAITVLSDPSRHADAVYELSGIRAWSASDLASGLDVEYAPVSLSEGRAQLANFPLLPFQPAMVMSIFSAAAAGFLEAKTSDLEKLLAALPRNSLEFAAAAARPTF
jgi:NAD(P)H dehydrogenase (quinone)